MSVKQRNKSKKGNDSKAKNIKSQNKHNKICQALANTTIHKTITQDPYRTPLPMQ